MENTVTVAVTLDMFCVRPFALHRQQTEKDKQNVDFAPPWKIFCGRPCLWVVFTGDGSRNKEIDARIGEANAVLRELYCSVVMKRELSKTAKLSAFKSVFVPILTCGHESSVTIERIAKRINGRDGIFAKSSRICHFVTKSTGLKSVKPGLSSHFSEPRDPSYVSSAMCPECHRKEWRTKSFGLQSTSTGKRPRGRPRTRWHDYITDFACSRLSVKPELSEIAVDLWRTGRHFTGRAEKICPENNNLP